MLPGGGALIGSKRHRGNNHVSEASRDVPKGSRGSQEGSFQASIWEPLEGSLANSQSRLPSRRELDFQGFEWV